MTENSLESAKFTFDFDCLPNDKIQEEVFIFSWLKNDGETINLGDPLYQVRVGKNIGIMCYVSQPLRAEKSGTIELCKKIDDQIFQGDVLYVIHEKGCYKGENIPSNKSFYCYFDKFKYSIPEGYSKHELEIKEWYKQDGDFVKAGELLFALAYRSSYDNKGVLNHYAEKTGYLDQASRYTSSLSQNDLIYVIHENDEDRIKRKFVNETSIKFDEFSKSKTIKWSRVGDNLFHGSGVTSNSLDGNSYLTFSFNNIENSDYIFFQFISKHFMLSKGDSIAFLFSNEKIIEFNLNSNSYKVQICDSEKKFENKLQITVDELQHFKNYDFIKWKIIFKKSNSEIVGGQVGNDAYKLKSNLNTVIKKFTTEYIELVKTEIENYTPLIQRDSVSPNLSNIDLEECYVYLMIDFTNGFHKIGISNKPEWREKTLQSEKPTIELVASKKFIKRKIASSFERALHETYINKRIRGEWFNLDESEVNEITITLNS